jgi:5-methylcytosine-specific restriction protein A
LPYKALKPCAYLGCPELVSRGFCEKHQRESEQRKKEMGRSNNGEAERAVHRLYDRHWRRRRQRHLASNPWCEDCLRVGIYTAATDVHHVIRHQGDREKFISSPLLSLCRDCHSRRTLGEIRGEREDYYPYILTPISLTVYLVCGAPASGKSRFVIKRSKPGDILIDLDEIISRITNHPIYFPEHREVVREGIRARNKQLEALQTITNRGQKVWMIVSAADPRDRIVWKDLLKPEATYILLCPQEECYRRIDQDTRRVDVAEDQKKAVVRWWAKYQPLTGEIIIDPYGIGGSIMF